jgi:hypothetical protein
MLEESLLIVVPIVWWAQCKRQWEKSTVQWIERDKISFAKSEEMQSNYVRDGGKGLASRLEDISQAFHLVVKPSAQCAVTTKSMSHFGFHKSLFVEGMRGMNVCTMAMIMGSMQFHIGLFPATLLQSSQSGHLKIHMVWECTRCDASWKKEKPLLMAINSAMTYIYQWLAPAFPFVSTPPNHLLPILFPLILHSWTANVIREPPVLCSP